MKNYNYSNTIAQGCLIAFLLIVLAQCAFGQKTGFQWNNAKLFQAQPKEKFLNWSSWTETWDGKQISMWAAYAISGIAHGSREAYHAEPTVFESRFGAGQTSFWGSKAWVRNYIDNNPENPHKKELIGNFGRDFWHTANIVDFVPTVTVSVIIGARKIPIKYRVANALAGVAVRTVFSFITYNSLRYN